MSPIRAGQIWIHNLEWSSLKYLIFPHNDVWWECMGVYNAPKWYHKISRYDMMNIFVIVPYIATGQVDYPNKETLIGLNMGHKKILSLGNYPYIEPQ